MNKSTAVNNELDYLSTAASTAAITPRQGIAQRRPSACPKKLPPLMTSGMIGLEQTIPLDTKEGGASRRRDCGGEGPDVTQPTDGGLERSALCAPGLEQSRERRSSAGKSQSLAAKQRMPERDSRLPERRVNFEGLVEVLSKECFIQREWTRPRPKLSRVLKGPDTPVRGLTQHQLRFQKARQAAEEDEKWRAHCDGKIETADTEEHDAISQLFQKQARKRWGELDSIVASLNHG